jgi:hypothetical protein
MFNHLQHLEDQTRDSKETQASQTTNNTWINIIGKIHVAHPILISPIYPQSNYQYPINNLLRHPIEKHFKVSNALKPEKSF